MNILRSPKLIVPFILILVSINISCDFFARNGGTGVSLSIEDSKTRGVFVSEYKSIQNPIRINDTLIISVKSAWLEHTWRYAGSESKKAEKENNGKYQIIVITDENNLKGYNENWLIGITPDSTFYSGYKNALITRLDSHPTKDTLSWKVQKGRELGKYSSKNFIGKLSLVKI